MDPERELLAQRLADLLLAGLSAIDREKDVPSADANLPEDIPDDVWPRVLELVRAGWSSRSARH